MNYPCLFVVAVLLLCAYGDLVKDGRLVQATDRPLEWNLVVDKSNRAASHFSFTNRKEKKPHIDKVISPSSSPIENVKTSSVNSPPDRTLSRVSKTEIDALKQTDATGYRAPLSTQSKSSFTRASTCSSRLYEVNLRHLNCSKRIFTKMCHGQCDSYSFPGRASLFSVFKHRRDVKNVCHCCAALSLRKIPHTVQCRTNNRLLEKTFYVPSVETCACLPCVIT